MGVPVATALKYIGTTLSSVEKHLGKLDLDRTTAIKVENWTAEGYPMNKVDDYFDCGGFDDPPNTKIPSAEENAWGVKKKPGAYGVCGSVLYTFGEHTNTKIAFLFYNPQTGSDAADAAFTTKSAEDIYKSWDDHDYKFPSSYHTYDDFQLTTSCGVGNHNKIIFGFTST